MNLSASMTIFSMSFKQSARRYPEALTRSLFYLIILYIFSKIWQHTKGLHFSGVVSQDNLVWYLSVTELTLLSLPLVHLTVNRDIRTGDFSTWLTKPYSYHSFQAFYAAGEYTFRFIVLAILGCSFCYLITRTLPVSVFQLFLTILVVYVAGLLHLRFLTLIGLSAVWIQDSNPIYWLWQRMAIVFGGVFIPIFLYPEYINAWFELTPFAALIANPASLIFTQSNLPKAITSLLVWSLILAFGEFKIYRHLYRLNQVHGG